MTKLTMPRAQRGARLLIEKGIPAEAILLDGKPVIHLLDGDTYLRTLESANETLMAARPATPEEVRAAAVRSHGR